MGILDLLFGIKEMEKEELGKNAVKSCERMIKHVDSIKRGDRIDGIYKGLMRVMPTIKREMLNEDVNLWFSFLHYYRDDIVTFEITTGHVYNEDIYIHASDSKIGIILIMRKNGKHEWKTELSDECKDNVLAHLERIIEKYGKMPTNEELYCKHVKEVVNPAKKEFCEKLKKEVENDEQ